MYNTNTVQSKGGEAVMPLASHVVALLEALRHADFEALPPAERERFAHQCERCATLARRRHQEHKKSVLEELEDGRGNN
jgi:hypothetical protein